jgi:hypothetical protein
MGLVNRGVVKQGWGGLGWSIFENSIVRLCHKQHCIPPITHV